MKEEDTVISFSAEMLPSIPASALPNLTNQLPNTCFLEVCSFAYLSGTMYRYIGSTSCHPWAFFPSIDPFRQAPLKLGKDFISSLRVSTMSLLPPQTQPEIPESSHRDTLP